MLPDVSVHRFADVSVTKINEEITHYRVSTKLDAIFLVFSGRKTPRFSARLKSGKMVDMGQYRHTSHTTYDNKFHIVWGTKYRKKVLRDDVGLRLREIVRQICSTEKIDILKGAIGADHVHLLLSIPPYVAVSRIVQHLKGESSRKLQMEFPILGKHFWGQHLWAAGYFCATTGTVTDKVVKDYIEQQGKNEEAEDRTFIVLG